MAKQIGGVYEKVYECAKKEFLEKGFKDASLRMIAQQAGTSTGSIYTRFHNKEGLFYAIVSPVLEDLKHWIFDVQEQFHQKNIQDQKHTVFEYSGEKTEEFVQYIYQYFDVFKLLIECSEGTKFYDFLNELIENELEYTIKFLDCIGSKSLKEGGISKEFLHIIITAYYSAIFEMVRHDMRKEDGMQYAKQLREFYYAGFAKIIN